jgi:protein subunit release factor B
VSILDTDIELHAWPARPVGGQHVNKYHCGCLAIHKPTGIAFVSTELRSQLANRNEAIKQLRLLVAGQGRT